MIPESFEPCTEVVIMGSNFENADYDNPRGYLYGFSSFVIATDSKGYRKRLYVSTSHLERVCLDQAERLSRALQNRLDMLNKLPVNFDSWESFQPVYGSIAYTESGEEDNLIAWERSLEEDRFYD